MKDIVLGIARHLLTAAGGALVAKGILDAGQAEIVSGSAIALLGVAASIIEKKLRK